MSRYFFAVCLSVILLVACPTLGKGPKGASKNQKSSGYSGKGVVTSSKNSKYSKRRSPLPSRTVIRKPTASPTRSSVIRQTPTKQTSNKYAKKRPTSWPNVSTGSNSRAGRTRKPVQFPTRPTIKQPLKKPSPITSGTRKPTKTGTVPARTSTSRPVRKPPVVFYPSTNKARPSKGTSTSPSRTEVRSSPQNTYSSRDKKRKYYSGLRPSQPSAADQYHRPSRPTVVNKPTIIHNSPTTINNKITNITNNVSNVNQWFTNNTWKNRVTVNSNNWNGRPWWHNPDYGSWHHGHWRGQYYYNGLDSWQHVDRTEQSWLSGLAAWGLGNLMYRSGYQVYSNPYYLKPIVIGTTTFNYSRPISVQRSSYEIAARNDEAQAEKLRNLGMAYFEAARESFFVDDYDDAFKKVNSAISILPDDATLHEFRALVLFAAGHYREAAEVIHAVLAVAPGWDWTTMSGLYPDHATYLRQLRSLEGYARANPRQPESRFLLAYHYLTMGYPERAEAQLHAAVILNPEDKLSEDLLAMLQEREEQSDDSEFAPAPHFMASLEQLQGDWKAVRPEGEIELEIDGEEFEWDYDFEANDDVLRGKFTLAQDLLILATKDGSQMVGRVTMPDEDHFTFRLLGTGNVDPGLTFVRR